jgi:hypothetical protein
VSWCAFCIAASFPLIVCCMFTFSAFTHLSNKSIQLTN